MFYSLLLETIFFVYILLVAFVGFFLSCRECCCLSTPSNLVCWHYANKVFNKGCFTSWGWHIHTEGTHYLISFFFPLYYQTFNCIMVGYISGILLQWIISSISSEEKKIWKRKASNFCRFSFYHLKCIYGITDKKIKKEPPDFFIFILFLFFRLISMNYAKSLFGWKHLNK